MFDKPHTRLVSFVLFVAVTALPGCFSEEPESAEPAVQITQATPSEEQFGGPFSPDEPKTRTEIDDARPSADSDVVRASELGYFE